MRVAHVTTAHARSDARIVHKECASLAEAGHEVVVVVADGGGPGSVHGVEVVDVGPSRGTRLHRATVVAVRALLAALRRRPAIVHVHDPELVPWCILLTLFSRTLVVFDAHEDLPHDILGKAYLPTGLRGPIAKVVEVSERALAPGLAAIVAATPTIERRYAMFHRRVVCVANYPHVGELHHDRSQPPPEHAVCYVGGLSQARGIEQMISALGHTRSKPRLKLAGEFVEPTTRERLTRHPEWRLVEELGFLDRAGVRECLASSLAGLVTLLPSPAYEAALPVKLFEYMSAELPVIASDFPLWREIVNGADCGICIDPRNPEEIAAAIDRLVEDPVLAARLGRNGRRAVETKYRWASEARKLTQLYTELGATTPASSR
ncbi:MAG: glycosyltransferase [Thioalkalivibrio sp.]|nr:glycosyltransferase [Thioalkalivibrio sp.]